MRFGGGEFEKKAVHDSTRLYHFHVENLRELETALKNLSLLSRAEIANGDPSRNVRSLVRLYALVLGCWAETRHKKLLYEKNSFDDSERQEILSKRKKIDQWKSSIDLAFRKHHNLGDRTIDRFALGVAQHARYQYLHEVLDEDLSIVIQIRNKLAHGQWIFPLNTNGRDVNSNFYAKINNENLLSLQFKLALLKIISAMVHDLVVSPPTFERDFEMHFKNLEQQRINLKNRKYEEYEKLLVFRKNRYKKRKEFEKK